MSVKEFLLSSESLVVDDIFDYVVVNKDKKKNDFWKKKIVMGI